MFENNKTETELEPESTEVLTEAPAEDKPESTDDTEAKTKTKRRKRSYSKKAKAKPSASATKTKRSFGCEIVSDERDSNFPLSAITPAVTSPMSKTKIHRLGVIMDQEESSACVGHALSLFIKSAPHMKKSPDPYEIYKKAQLIDEFEGEEPRTQGTSIRAGIKTLIEDGLLKPSYYWAFDASSIWKFIVSRGPVLIGTYWYSGMNETDSKGFVSLSGEKEGGHAYLVYGVDASKKAFLCANSWGEKWADKGRFWVSFENMDKLLREGGQACSAEEN